MSPDDLEISRRVAAVVIMYHPLDSIVLNAQSYLPDAGVLYAWDNSPGYASSVVKALTGQEKVEYVTEGGNAGIARALNVAAVRASTGGYEYLLTMDQDSFATPGMVRTMLSCAGNDPSIGLITPYQLDRNAPLTPPGLDVEPVESVLTSGNLVRLDVHARVGGFLEKLFIDYVDTEYSLRIREEGFRVVRVNRAVLSHAEGHYTPRKFFGVTVYPANHSPARYYYRARNRLYVSRRYGNRFPIYVKFMDRMYWRTLVKMFLYERHRIRKFVMACRGFTAYWRGDYSPIPTEWD
jgi:rhamnosyltransferase